LYDFLFVPATLLLAMRWSLFREDRFLGKVLDEWTVDSLEVVPAKLPRLIVIAIISLFLSRVLHLFTFHRTRLAKQRTTRATRIAEVKTLAGVIRATGLAVIALIAGFMSLDVIGFNLGRHGEAPARDPTTLKPAQSNPFTGD
jgi:small conductance mechanosensitive channel